MDLSYFPPELIRYISTFLYIVSWRAEYHYFKLRNHFMTLRRKQHVPPRIMASITETPDCYIYPHPSGHLTRAYKWDPPAMARMKYYCLNLYTDPLMQYLSQYRRYVLNKAWVPNASFQLLGVHINVVSPDIYAFHLYNQGSIEARLYSSWQGCLPLSAYKKACLSSIPTI